MGTAGWIILGLLVLVGLWLIMTYNGLVALRQRCRQAFSDIDVQLKQRHDLMPNLVETVKGYAVARAGHAGSRGAGPQRRRQRAGAGGPGRRPKACCRARCGSCSRCRRPIPTSRPTRTSSSCRASLSDLENKIAAARRFFNNTAAEYNSTRESFPAVLFAQSMGFGPQEFFNLDEGERTRRADRAASEVLARQSPLPASVGRGLG